MKPQAKKKFGNTPSPVASGNKEGRVMRAKEKKALAKTKAKKSKKLYFKLKTIVRGGSKNLFDELSDQIQVIPKNGKDTGNRKIISGGLVSGSRQKLGQKNPTTQC